MKRSIAITILFVGLNALILWITSHDQGIEPLIPATDTKTGVERAPTLLAPDETLRGGRSLLFGSMKELVSRLGEEYQAAAAKSIPSLVRVHILWRDGDNLWNEETVGGVCVDQAGFYAAPWPFVSRGELLRIEFPGGSRVAATLDSIDPATEIALLRTGRPDLARPIPFGSSLNASFGSPLMLLWLDSEATPRSIQGFLNGVSYQRHPAFPSAVKGLLQTDMPVTRAEAGGCLIDLEGNLTGLLVYPVGDKRDFHPMLSADQIQFVSRQLQENGLVVRSTIGITTQALSSDLRAAIGLPAELNGALVGRVDADSPAEIVGIRVGDVITSFNERRINSAGFFESVVSRWPQNKPIPLTVWRKGEILSLAPLAVAEATESPSILQPDEPAETPASVESSEQPSESVAAAETPGVDSVVVDEPPILDPLIRAFEWETPPATTRSSFAPSPALRVRSIDPRRILITPEVLPGDELLQVGDYPIRDAAALDRLPDEVSRQPALLLRFSRNGDHFWAVGRPPNHPVRF